MADLERYSDYNDIDDEVDNYGGRRHKILGRVLKIFVCLFLFSICGLIIVRMLLSGYYPKEMKSFYLTDHLRAYAETASLNPEKASIGVPYDNNKDASFVAGNLFLEKDAGALQLSVRMTSRTFQILAERLGMDQPVDYDGVSGSLFSFSLVDNYGNRYTPSYTDDTSYLWYHATKLCFDGVDLSDELDLAWIRLDIYYIGDGEPAADAEPYASIPVYVLKSELA
jgi:hypothetical protein